MDNQKHLLYQALQKAAKAYSEYIQETRLAGDSVNLVASMGYEDGGSESFVIGGGDQETGAGAIASAMDAMSEFNTVISCAVYYYSKEHQDIIFSKN